MPVSYSFDDRIIVVRMQGKYSTADLEDAILASVRDPARPADPLLMFDLRESLALPDRPTADVRGVALFLVRQRDHFGRRLAMVASSDLAYGLMRVGAMTAETGGVTARVFREHEPARAWLLGEEAPDEAHAGASPAGAPPPHDSGDAGPGARPIPTTPARRAR